jgi:uncharacterized protein (TIGR02444 family)
MNAAPTQTLDNPFWAFSLAVYGADGVEPECLDLQERFRVDVNLLLFAAYAGACDGVQLEAADITAVAAAVSAWHDEIVRALRGARRALKPLSLDDNSPLQAPTAELRAQVKAAELYSEKIEQCVLWLWWQRHLAGRARTDKDTALVANVQRVLAHYRAPVGSPTPAALHAAASAFAASNS